MAIIIQSGFDTDLEGSYVSVQADDGFGVLTANITGTLFPSISGTIDGTLYASAIDDLISKLNSLGGTWTGGYVLNTNKFSLNSSTGYKITMNSFTKKLFGFEDSPIVAITSSVSIKNPFFIYKSNAGGISNDSEGIEKTVPFREIELDNGYSFGLPAEGNSGFAFLGQGNQDGYTKRTFQLLNERVYNIFSQYSSSLSPYTWQNHVEHARTYTPWVLFSYNSASNVTYDDRKGTYKFSVFGSAFKAKTMFSNQSQFWTINIDAHQLSRGTDFGKSPFLLETL